VSSLPLSPLFTTSLPLSLLLRVRCSPRMVSNEMDGLALVEEKSRGMLGDGLQLYGGAAVRHGTQGALPRRAGGRHGFNYRQ
jgi:hypothetical protein